MTLEFKNYKYLSEAEHLQVLEIRNSDYVRNNMKNKNIINIECHLEWADNLKIDNESIYYAVFFDKVIVGAVYITELDYIISKSTWGLYFKKNINPLISSLSAYILFDYIFNTLHIQRLNLEVNKLNINAYKFDLNFGFQVYDEYTDNIDDYYLMSIKKDVWNEIRGIGLLKIFNKKLEKVNYKFINKEI